MMSRMIEALTNEKYLYAFLMMAVGVGLGYFFRRRGIIGSDGKQTIKVVIWNFALPAMAFGAFMNDFSPSDMIAGGVVLVSSLLFYVVFILVGKALFHKQNKDKADIAAMMGAIGQLTLFTMPLIESLGLTRALFYCGLMTLSFRSVLYFIAYPTIVGRNTGRKPWKKVFLTPVMAAMVLGFFVFLTQGFICVGGVPILRIDLTLPAVYAVIKTLSSLVMPLSMLLIGVILGESSLAETMKDKVSWAVALMRTVLCPLIVYLVTFSLPSAFDADARIALTLGFAAPSSATLCVFCVSAGKEEVSSSRMAAMSALLSLFFVPLYTLLTVYH